MLSAQETISTSVLTQMADLESPEPTAWAIRGVELKFLRPGRVDDTLSVRTLCTAITGARNNNPCP